MSYKIKTKQTFAENFQRIAAAQIERAMACLDPEADIHKGAHEARKTFKRLRALLSLYRGALDRTEARDLDVRLRDIGQALAGTRDVQAMLDSLAMLQAGDDRKARSAPSGTLGTVRRQTGRSTGAEIVLAALRRRMEDRRAAVAAEGKLDLERWTALRADVRSAGELLQGLQPGEAGFDAIRPGLERVYRAARRRRVAAYADGSGESFHEWRKALQRHWRHMQLLTPVWPRELRARAVATRAVAETVGQDHDLMMLDAHLSTQGRGLGTAAQLRACRRLCADRQAELRASIEAEGELLFTEGATAFADRMERYWELARSRQEPRRTASVELA